MLFSMSEISKVVIPVAGLGTRFAPATKAIPKEMLPVVDTPAIQYVVEEAARAGLQDVLMITGRNKSALEDHFDRNWELERALEAKGDQHRLKRVRKSANLGNIFFVRQGEPLGLGHAVLCAKAHVGDQPFAVLLGDDLIDAREHLLDQMRSRSPIRRTRRAIWPSSVATSWTHRSSRCWKAPRPGAATRSS